MVLFLKELLFRLRLYLNGIRFYDAERLDDAVLVKEVSAHLFGWTESAITLYQLKCIDFVLKRGVLTPDTYISYIAKVSTHAGATDKEKMLLDGKLFFINGRSNQLDAVDREPDVIIEVFIDVLKGYLRNL